jgi:hypothetical protein
VDIVVADTQHDRDRPRESVAQVHRLEDRAVVGLGLEPGKGAERAGREHLEIGELPFADRELREVGGLVGEGATLRVRRQQVHEGTAVGRDGPEVIGHGKASLGVGPVRIRNVALRRPRQEQGLMMREQTASYATTQSASRARSTRNRR